MKHFITLALTCLPLLCLGAPSISYTSYFNNTHTYTNSTVSGSVSSASIVLTNSFRNIPSALTPSGTNVTVDFSASGMRTLSLTTNALFAASNLSAGTRVAIRVLADSTTRNLYWPAAWVPIGAPKPGSIAASKYAECELVSWGTTDADVTVKYAEQP